MRVAVPRPFTVESIEQLRADVLGLMRNVQRILDGTDPDYDRLRTAVRAWRADFFDRMYRGLDLTGAVRGRLTGGRVPDNEAEREAEKSAYETWKKKIGAGTWDLYIYLGGFPFPDDWASEKDRWAEKIRRAARKAWKVLGELVDWSGPTTEDVQVVEDASIEGMAVRIVGFDDTDHDNEAVGALRAGLRRYKTNATRWCPALLAQPLPIQYRFDCRVGLGGRYETTHVVLCAQTDPAVLAQYLAHEMGHHVFKTVLSGPAVEYWSQACHRDLHDLDLQEVRDVWARHADLDVYELVEALEGPEPALSLQLAGAVFGYSQHAGRPSWTTLDGLDAYLEEPGATPTLTVPAHPVTAYGSKNAEETFCEVLGLLIGYGPRTIDPAVRALFDTVTNDLVRSARTAGFEEFKRDDTTILYRVHEQYVELISLRTPVRKRGSGSGRRAMLAFIDAMSVHHVPIRLVASPLDTKTSLGRLVRFYESLGFKQTGERGNMAGDPVMRLDSPVTNAVTNAFLTRNADLLVRLAARPMKESAILALMAKMRKRQGTFRGAELKQVLEYLGWTVSEKVAWRHLRAYAGKDADDPDTYSAADLRHVEAVHDDYAAHQVDELPDPTTLKIHDRVYRDVGPVREHDGPYGKTYSFTYQAWQVATDVVLEGPGGHTWTGPLSLAEWLSQYPNGPCLKWLYGETPFLQQVSDRLGLPTHEAEKADRTRTRTRDNTGTCPVCFRNQKMTPGSLHGSDRTRPGMVLHGYMRPGLGYVVGNCFGQGWPPFELSSEGTVAWVARLHDHVLAVEVSIANLESGKVEVLVDREKPVKKTDVPEHEWNRIVHARLDKLRSELKSAERTIDELEKQVKSWTLSALPGTKEKLSVRLSR